MIYVVLGMHKSGTTLVARLLDESGIDMGDFDSQLGYGDGNTFERHETQAVNRSILEGCLVPPLEHLIRRRHRPSHDRAGYPANRDSQSLIRRRRLEQRLASSQFDEAIDAIVESCRDHRDWGFKDPRTALTYPIWKRRLPPHKLVVVHRSLAQTLERARATARHPARRLRVVHAWTLHNWMICQALEHTESESIVLRYEDLMSGDEAVKQLSAFVGRDLHDARDAKLYRARTSAGTPGWVRPLRPFLPIGPDQLQARLAQLGERNPCLDP